MVESCTLAELLGNNISLVSSVGDLCLQLVTYAFQRLLWPTGTKLKVFRGPLAAQVWATSLWFWITVVEHVSEEEWQEILHSATVRMHLYSSCFLFFCLHLQLQISMSVRSSCRTLHSTILCFRFQETRLKQTPWFTKNTPNKKQRLRCFLKPYLQIVDLSTKYPTDFLCLDWSSPV